MAWKCWSSRLVLVSSKPVLQKSSIPKVKNSGNVSSGIFWFKTCCFPKMKKRFMWKNILTIKCKWDVGKKLKKGKFFEGFFFQFQCGLEKSFEVGGFCKSPLSLTFSFSLYNIFVHKHMHVFMHTLVHKYMHIHVLTYMHTLVHK